MRDEPIELAILSARDIRRLLPIGRAIERMEATMLQVSAGGAHLPLRTTMALEGKNHLGLMSGYMAHPPCFGVKAAALYPDNPQRGFSSHMGLMLLFDAPTGKPLAVLSASALTAIRTAAASAVATRALARPDAAELAILGTGEQASNHVEAMLAVRPLRRIRVWGRSEDSTARFVERARASTDIAVEPCGDAEQAVSGADIVCTTTASVEPVLAGRWIAAGAHVNLVGSSHPNSCELDIEGVRRGRFFVDYRPSALAQAGELHRAVEAGVVGWEHIQAEIGEVLAATRTGRRTAAEVTIYKSLGVSAQDLAAAYHVYQRALEEQGVARVVI